MLQRNGEKLIIVLCSLDGLLSLRRPFTRLDTEIPCGCNDKFQRSHACMHPSESLLYGTAGTAGTSCLSSPFEKARTGVLLLVPHADVCSTHTLLHIDSGP